MKLIEAENLAKQLMQQHNLLKTGWSFSWKASEISFGTCSFISKTIYLSLDFTRLNSEVEVKDTILHEIAHAIAGYEAGHGNEWKAICKKIGARPEAKFNDDYAFSESTRYIAFCECGKQYKSPVKLPLYCTCQKDKKPKVYLTYSDRKNAK